jgi:hypothetical protein
MRKTNLGTAMSKNQPSDAPMHIGAIGRIDCGLDLGAIDDALREYREKVFPPMIEKPCGVLSWCPYGPLVEGFPLDEADIDESTVLRSPERCMVFGHYCPAFFTAEPFADLEAMARNLI